MNARADVIVVGAGLSGLRAARELFQKGKRVVVLEAQDHVGGRMLSAQLCGRTVDLGAQWVSPRHTRLLAEARRFGMETLLQYSEGNRILSLEGQRSEFVGEVPSIAVLAQVELAMLQRRWNREIATLPVGAPWSAAKARQWDSQTLETWIQKNLSTGPSRAFARLAPAFYGTSASEVSYLWMLEMLRSTRGLEHLMNVKSGAMDATFKGGAHQLAQNMADALDESIVLSSPVRAILQDEGGIGVKTDAGAFNASYAIVAVSPMTCSRIALERISPQRRVLAQHMPQSAVLKFQIAYEERFWRTHGYSGQVATDSLALGLVMESTNEMPMLTGLAQGKHALELAAMDADARREKIIACLIDLFGPDAGNLAGYAEKDWLADEWACGYAGMAGPGVLTQYGEALREPCGHIHWACSETAREWPGYMEGALESGERAAGEVLARL